MMTITNGKNEKIIIRPTAGGFVARQYTRVGGAWNLIDTTITGDLNAAATWGNTKYAVKPRIGFLSDNWVRGAVAL